MDLVIGLVGGLVLTYIVKMFWKGSWGAAVVGLVVTLLILGFSSSGITIMNGVATLVGALIGHFVGPKKSAKA